MSDFLLDTNHVSAALAPSGPTRTRIDGLIQPIPQFDLSKCG